MTHLLQLKKRTLFYNEGTCIRTESIIQRHQDHAIAISGLLRQDPLRAVLGVDPDESIRSRGESLGHHSCAEVLGPQKSLVVA